MSIPLSYNYESTATVRRPAWRAVSMWVQPPPSGPPLQLGSVSVEEVKVTELLPNGLTKVELPQQTDENKQAWRQLYDRFREIAREAKERASQP
jgi:hypothetical protein